MTSVNNSRHKWTSLIAEKNIFHTLCHWVTHHIQQWAHVFLGLLFAANVPVEAFLIAFHIPHQFQLPAELWLSYIFIPTHRGNVSILNLGSSSLLPPSVHLHFAFEFRQELTVESYWPPAIYAQHLLPWQGPCCPRLHLHHHSPILYMFQASLLCIQHLTPQTHSLHSLFHSYLFVCFKSKAHNFQHVLSWYFRLHYTVNDLLKPA